MERQHFVAAALLGLGAALFALSFTVYRKQHENLVERPEATGDVGFLSVYAQTPRGPVRLQPNRRRNLRRPQDIAFQWSVQGTGPRAVRIEMQSARGRTVLHEERLSAPADAFSLDYVLTLGDEMDDDLTLVVVLEAPHTVGYQSRYDVHLSGASAPWDIESSSTAKP